MAVDHDLNEIKEYLYPRIRDDATFRTLTGSVAADRRIYYRRPQKKVIISGTYPAYITYYRMAGGGAPPDGVDTAQMPDEFWSFDVWAKSERVARNVEARLLELFPDGHTFTTTTYLVTNMTFEGDNEMVDEDPTETEGIIWHIQVRFRLPVYLRSGGLHSY